MAVILALVHAGAGSRSEASGDAWVDPARLSFSSLPGWADPRWIDTLEDLAAQTEPFIVGDGQALQAFGERLLELPFIERLGELGADRRRGLFVELSLCRPEACIPVGEGFLLVSRDGVVLPGRWEDPPRSGSGFLPVIGPVRDAELFALARPGDWLVDPSHLDAIDVAISLREHLDETALGRLGRCLIDASRAPQASVEEPGIRLLLEDKRLCLFGRSPATEEPGELSVAAKWNALACALALFEATPPRDWDLVDCRWDRPDLRLTRSPRLAGVAAISGRARKRPDRRGESETGASRTVGPRVR